MSSSFSGKAVKPKKRKRSIFRFAKKGIVKIIQIYFYNMIKQKGSIGVVGLQCIKSLNFYCFFDLLNPKTFWSRPGLGRWDSSHISWILHSHRRNVFAKQKTKNKCFIRNISDEKLYLTWAFMHPFLHQRLEILWADGQSHSLAPLSGANANRPRLKSVKIHRLGVIRWIWKIQRTVPFITIDFD